MRILNINVYNFGILSNANIDLNDNFSKILEHNGWGKSTLSDFITVMFYGFKDSKKKKEEKERDKYRPWQGGDYGGSIKFEAKGKYYSLSRIFGSKDSEDKFELKDLDNNIISHDYSTNIGFELFDLDRESFERTIYIDRNGCHTEMTSNISAKLGNLIDNTDDINNFDTADEYLKKALNSLSPTLKSGSIKKLNDEIYGLSINAERKENYSNDLERIKTDKQQKEKDLKDLIDTLRQLQDEQNKLSVIKDVQTKKQEYDSLYKNYQDRKAIYEKNRSKFPKDVPLEKDLKIVDQKITKLNKTESERNVYTLTGEEINKLNKYKPIYGSSPTSLEEIDEIRELIRTIDEVEKDAARFELSQEEKKHIDDFSSIFSNNPVDIDYINSLKEKWNDRNTKKELLEYKKNNRVNIKKGKLLFGIVLIILAIVGFVFSFIYQYLVYDYYLYVNIGFALLALVGLVLIISYSSSKRKTIQALQSEMNEEEMLINGIESEIDSLFKLYNVELEEKEVYSYLDSIIYNYERYNTSNNKIKEHSKIMNQTDIETKKKKVVEYVSRYKSNVDYYRCEGEIDNIYDDYNEYSLLTEKNKNYEKKNKECEELNKVVDGYFKYLGFDNAVPYETTLNTISDNLKEYTFSLNEYKESIKSYNEFVGQNNVQAIQNVKDSGNKTIEQLNQEINGVSEKIDVLKEEIHNINLLLEEIRESYDNSVEDEGSIKEKKKQLDKENEKYNLLLKTKELLNKAKSSFVNNYVEPITDSFKKYYGMATNEASDRYSFDANATLTYQEHGLDRSENTLSSGYQDIVGLCFRMALIDVMYQGEKPFIIMDDPFTNLDEEKIKGSLSMLEKMSEEYQIIYLTCHESRK